jgi:hypothetical protein
MTIYKVFLHELFACNTNEPVIRDYLVYNLLAEKTSAKVFKLKCEYCATMR